MRRFGWMLATIGCLALVAAACGGGSSKKITDLYQEDAVDETTDDVAEDVKDAGPKDQGPQKDGVTDPGKVDNGPVDVIPDVPPADVEDGTGRGRGRQFHMQSGSLHQRPQNTPSAASDKKTYVNDQCAQCALCSDCTGCKGTIACGDDPTTFLKHKESCADCPCDPSVECKTLGLTDCGQICGYDETQTLHTYANPCGLKRRTSATRSTSPGSTCTTTARTTAPAARTR